MAVGHRCGGSEKCCGGCVPLSALAALFVPPSFAQPVALSSPQKTRRFDRTTESRKGATSPCYTIMSNLIAVRGCGRRNNRTGRRVDLPWLPGWQALASLRVTECRLKVTKGHAGLHEPSRPAAPRIEHAFKNRELPTFDVPTQVQATQKIPSSLDQERKNQN